MATTNLDSLSLSGTLTVAGAQTFTGNQSIGGTLSVTGAQTLTGNTTHSGNVSIAGTLGVTGVATLTAGVAAGTGSGTYKPSGRLGATTSQVATGNNTTETDGHTYTLPANSLTANGQAVRAVFTGTTAATANNKTVKIYLGSTALYTTGAVAANNKPWQIEVLIVRVGATSQKILVSGHFNNTQITTSISATAAEDLTTALTIKNTMTNGTAAASDATTELSLVEYVL